MSQEDLYTLRWHVRRLTGHEADKTAALGLLARLLGEQPKPEPAEADPGVHPKFAFSSDTLGGKLRCPFATQHKREARARGRYPQGYPEGAVVHFTAGRESQTVADALNFQASKGHMYFVIDAEGRIGQNFDLNEHGYHAGESYWEGLGRYVSNRVVGIEVLCPGQLDGSRRPWFSREPYPEEVCRYVEAKDNRVAGWFYAYTKQQEQALEQLLCWLHLNNPDIFRLDYVLGHDEVAGPAGLGWQRKTDPGGSLSVTMPQFRSKLKALVQPEDV